MSTQASGHCGIAIGTGALVNGARSTAVGGFAGNGPAAPSTNTDNAAFGYTAGYSVAGALDRDSGRTVTGGNMTNHSSASRARKVTEAS
jgi:hypothetical protein